jgi:glutaredoxin
MNKIIIHTNESCPYCKQIKDELTNNNIEFENRFNSEFKKEWEEIINLTGMPTVPTIIYNNEYLVAGRDFANHQHLINILQNFPDCSYDYTKRTFERVKTLNYNINMAFGKLDQLLKQIETKINTDEHKSTD